MTSAAFSKERERKKLSFSHTRLHLIDTKTDSRGKGALKIVSSKIYFSREKSYTGIFFFFFHADKQLLTDDTLFKVTEENKQRKILEKLNVYLF